MSAKACFLERGFHAASVEWLAEQAGYTIGAIYSSFGSKAGLFMAVLDRRSEGQIETWRAAAAAPDPQAAIVRLLEDQLRDEDFLPWTSVYFEFLLYASRDPELKPMLAARLERNAGELEAALEPLSRRTSIRPRDFAKLLRALSNGLALTARLEDTTDVADLVGALLSGLDPAARPAADPSAEVAPAADVPGTGRSGQAAREEPS
jgi:AcrR family transcriptional regulator